MPEENKNQIAQFDRQLAMAKSVKDLFENVDVKSRAIKGYLATTGRKDGEFKFQQERAAYLEIIHQKPELKQAPMYVHFKVINRVMQNGWSLRDNRIYLQAVKHGDKIVDIKVDPSPAVRREMMELMKTVKMAPEAQIVLKGDIFVYDKLNQTIIKHENTDKTVPEIKLENIMYSYQRIIWTDGRITDVVVPYNDLLQAKKKSKIKSTEAGLWAEFPGEACKKTATNRAFRLYHRYSDNQVIIDEDDDDNTQDTTHTDVTYEGDDGQVEIVDTDTGEVTEQPAQEATVVTDQTRDQAAPTVQKDKKQYNLLSED
jgi:hypothetical protein